LHPQDKTLAVDGKTMCNAIDDKGHQTHIMSAVGHESAICYHQLGRSGGSRDMVVTLGLDG
jgi:hypothetical protein